MISIPDTNGWDIVNIDQSIAVAACVGLASLRAAPAVLHGQLKLNQINDLATPVKSTTCRRWLSIRSNSGILNVLND